MAAPGRNAPCPCGSGKKYKKCCLAEQRQQEEDALSPSFAERALSWLLERHGKAFREAVENRYIGRLDEDERARFDGLDPTSFDMFEINLGEWMLADAKLRRGTSEVKAVDLLLERGGLIMSVEDRQYLEQLAARPLRLYEVIESRPGEGLQLVDWLSLDDPETLDVEEKSASRSLRKGDVFGARLIWWNQHWELSGTIYPLDFAARASVRELHETLVEESWSLERQEEAIVTAIIDAWLHLLCAPPPQLIHRSTGDPMLLVTDHYQVEDWDRLEAALAAEENVEGDRVEGWVLLEPELPGQLGRRSRLALNLGKKDRLEAFAQTRARADEGKRWLQVLAGDSVRFLQRELTDPAHSFESDLSRSAASGDASRIPLLDQVSRQQIYEQIYRDWPHLPIPALGDLAPLEACASSRGQRAVVDLLKSYEEDTRREVEGTGEEAVSFIFLWEAVGLDRDSFVR